MCFYLYVKTHNITGLKYLGYTKHDPYTYTGSGKYWKRHMKKHGYDVGTEIIGTYDRMDQLKEAGIHYSHLWNVVESDQWANLRLEEGTGGNWWSGRKQTKEHVQNNRLAQLGKKRTEEMKLKMRKPKSEAWKQLMRKPKSLEHREASRQAQLRRTKHPMSGKIHTEETRRKMSEARARYWETINSPQAQTNRPL